MVRGLAKSLTFVVICITVCKGIDPQLCKRREGKCSDSSCETLLPCYHGDCGLSGRCECDLCWQGEACNEYVDRYQPVFLEEIENVLISDPWSTDTFYTVRAHDGDLGTTCPVDSMVCECAETRYSIVSGNEDGLFFLNNITGDLYVREADLITIGQTYTMVIAANGNDWHPNHRKTATLQLEITVDNLHHHLASKFQNSIFSHEDENLIRTKRAVDDENYLTEFNFTLLAGETETMECGKRLDYRLEIQVPKTDGMDLTVEFFTKEIGNGNYTPCMALFNVEIEDKVDGLSFSKKGGPHIEMLLSEEISTAYDRAIITFGEVKNTNADKVPIVMYFSVTQIRNPNAILDVKYLVTAGAEYDRENYIWVGQSEVTVHNSTDDRQIEVDILGSREIALDSAGVFVIMAHIAIRSENFTVDVMGPEETDVVTIGNLGVKDFDVNYDPVPQSIYFYNTTMDGSDYDVLYKAATLYLGIMTNVGEYEKPKDLGNVINVTFAVYALNNETNIGKERDITVIIWNGRDKIYTDTITVTIVPRKDADKMVTARFTKSELAKPFASTGDMVMYTFWSNLTNAGYADYVVEVEVPRDNKGIPRLEACSARLWNYKGSFDIPYINSSFVDPDLKDGKFVFMFNRIHVTDQRTPSIYNDSMMYVHLIVKVSSMAVNKESTTLTPTVRIGTQGSATTNIEVTGITIRNEKDELHPTTMLSNAVKWSELFVGGAVVLNITVSVPPTYGYAEVLVETSGESDPPLPPVHICRAELSDVQRNLPCLRMHQDEVNLNHTKYRLSNTKTRKKPDIASVLVGDVGALPVEGMNAFVVSVVMELPEASIIKDGDMFPFTSGINIMEKNIYGGIANYTMRKGPPPNLIDDDMPEAWCKYKEDESVVPGHLAEVDIIMVTKIQTISNYSLEIEAITNDVSMCGLKVKTFGRNIPCIDPDTEPFYEPHDNPLDGNKVAGLKFSALSNIGFRSDPEHDKLVVVALVRVSPACRKSKVDLEWRTVFGGGVRSGPVQIAVDLKADTSDMFTSDMEAKALSFKPAFANKAISIGSPVVVDLEVSLEPGSLAPVMVQMKNADAGKKKIPYDMCLGGIWFRGKNYPCFSPVQVESNFSSSDSDSGHNDSAVYNLGLVCNTFVDSREEENKVTVRMAMRPLEDGTLKIRDQFHIEGLATVGSRQKKIDTLKFQIAREADQVETEKNASLKLVNPEPIPIRIHQRLWIPFNITIPIDSILKVDAEARGEVRKNRAVLTVHNMRLVSGGVNIPCPSMYPQPTVEKAPKVPTTQTDIIQAYLGRFSSLGLTQKMNLMREGDDDLKVEVEVEMSDHPDTHHEELFYLTFAVTAGRSVLEVKQPMRVWRDGSERADFDVTIKVDGNKTYQSGDSINVTVTMFHKEESRAEPINATVRLYLPPYVEFSKPIFNNATTSDEVQFITEAGGLDIVFTQFLFSDSATIVVSLLADPNNKRGFGRGEVNATTPYRVLCTQNYREEPSSNPATANTIVSCGPVDHIMYVVNSQECYTSLGLYSPKKVYKCQLSASSAAKKETGPFNIRMGSKRGWSPALRLGPYKPYFQVDFLRQTRVAKIEFAKIEGFRPVMKYLLLYSHTGYDWLVANNPTELVYKKNDKAVDVLEKPVQARFVRIVIEEADGTYEDTQYIGLKMEMYGCFVAEKSTSVSCAKDDPTWYSDDRKTYGRHFSVDITKDVVCFCDLEYDMVNLACFCSTDGGTSWRRLPNSFGGILGYDRKTSRTYAVDKRNRAYMASDDGVSWIAVEETEVNNTMAKKSFFKSQPVPAFTSEDIAMLETKTGRWEASFDGLVYDGKLEPKVRWSRCCKIR